jgi:trans-aconitate methyltransferase
MQMPDSWKNPTHTLPAEILDDGTWPSAAQKALLRDRLSNPAEYRQWMQPGHVDMWRTTYFQVLPSTLCRSYHLQFFKSIMANARHTLQQIEPRRTL